MKKVLLTTSILAFAGSAFAANASGYVLSAYKNVKGSATASENGKSQFTETEIYLSGSKTASNGLTFGANYTIGWDGDKAKHNNANSLTIYDNNGQTTNANKLAFSDISVTSPATLATIAGTGTATATLAQKNPFITALLSIRNNNRGIRLNKASLARFLAEPTVAVADYSATGLMQNATDGFGNNLGTIPTMGTATNANTGAEATDQDTFIDAMPAATIPASTVENPVTHEVSSFVSGSFGKVTMGAHAFASKSHGVSALSVGNGINGGITAVAGRHDSKKGLTYETPVFNGLSAAYTMEFGTNTARSYAVHYSAQYAGIGLKAAYGSFKQGLGNDIRDGYEADIARDHSWGVQVSKGPFAVSYARGTDKTTKRTYVAGDIDSDADKKQTRWGVSYNAGKVSIGYSRLSEKQGIASTASGSSSYTVSDATKKTSSVISVSYAVASGLDVFMEQQKVGDVKTQLIGTNISF
ncbi:MAG: porin [Alphaproteobacteria bacterium]